MFPQKKQSKVKQRMVVFWTELYGVFMVYSKVGISQFLECPLKSKFEPLHLFSDLLMECGQIRCDAIPSSEFRGKMELSTFPR